MIQSSSSELVFTEGSAHVKQLKEKPCSWERQGGSSNLMLASLPSMSGALAACGNSLASASRRSRCGLVRGRSVLLVLILRDSSLSW